MIAGILLAAGDSARMGRAKALLPIGDTTFLGRCISLFRESGINRIFIVTGHAHEHIAAAAEQLDPDVVCVNNPHPEDGQYSSLKIGIASLPPDTEAALLHLVDHPLVSSSTVEAVLLAWRRAEMHIVIPSHNRRRGHPVLYPSGFFPRLLAASPEHGARDILTSHEREITYVDVDDPGIRIDIDTPEEYAKYLQ